MVVYFIKGERDESSMFTKWVKKSNCSSVGETWKAETIHWMFNKCQKLEEKRANNKSESEAGDRTNAKPKRVREREKESSRNESSAVQCFSRSLSNNKCVCECVWVTYRPLGPWGPRENEKLDLNQTWIFLFCLWVYRQCLLKCPLIEYSTSHAFEWSIAGRERAREREGKFGFVCDTPGHWNWLELKVKCVRFNGTGPSQQ